MRTLRLALSALVVCVALSACGGQDGGDGTPSPSPTDAPATSPPGPTPASPSPSPSTRVPDDPVDPTIPDPPLGTKRPGGPTPPPPVGDTTLTGTVAAGVEPNCLLLDGYLLIGGPRDVLAVGAKVSVTGRAQPGMMTTCQQGIPFLVESARRG